MSKYPIYIISKGRWKSRLTSKALEKLNVAYKIVIEPQEYDLYANVIDSRKILVLPFSNLGQGSIPARNWVMEHSIKNGHKRHWILDDNINGFVRLNHGYRIPLRNPVFFRCMEDFCDRYKNIKIAGMNYRFFAGPWTKKPYYLNTRVYSAILLSNDIEFRWRGKYNEDTDLSLRILKAGFCSVLFNIFLINKIATMKMPGGNTDEVYRDSENRLKFAESLKKQHPEHVKIVWRYNRWHHEVNYDDFKQKLIRVDNYDEIVKKGVNNYGMILKKVNHEIKKDNRFKTKKNIFLLDK